MGRKKKREMLKADAHHRDDQFSRILRSGDVFCGAYWLKLASPTGAETPWFVVTWDELKRMEGCLGANGGPPRDMGRLREVDRNRPASRRAFNYILPQEIGEFGAV